MNSKKSEKLKLQGNELFSKENYLEALICYSEAIKYDPSNPILYSNRAYTYIKLNEFLKAEKDCDKAIELNNSFVKALFRRGIARKGLHKYKSSLQDFQKALSLFPDNKDIKTEIESLNKMIHLDNSIRIYPILKNEQFRSKLPLREIPIINNEIKLINKENIDNRLYDHMKNLINDQNPKNFVEFDLFWRECKDINLKIQYLESISLQNYRKIFEYPLEPKLLLDIIEALSQSKNSLITFQILEMMTKMPRFDLNFSFITKQEYEVLKNIFTKLFNTDSIPNEKIYNLAQQFNININK